MKNMNGRGRGLIDNLEHVARQQNHVDIAGATSASTQDGMGNGNTALPPAAQLRGVSDRTPQGWMAGPRGLAILLVRVDAKLVCDAD